MSPNIIKYETEIQIPCFLLLKYYMLSFITYYQFWR